MKTLKVTTLMAAFVGLTLAAPAMAQREPTGISLEVGGNYILKSEVRDAVGDLGLRVGLGYQLPTPSLLGANTGGRPSVNLSYTTADDDVKLTTWGLTYEERVPFQMAARPGGTSPYWGVGVGLFFHKAEADYVLVAEKNSVSENGSENGYGMDEKDTRIGLRAILGVDFASKWFVEGSYNFTGKVADGKTDSIALVGGVRF